MALFPELARFQTAEARLDHLEAQEMAYWRKIRSNEAQNWRKARALLRTLDFSDRVGTLIYWNRYCSCPATSVYFIEIVRRVAAGQLDPAQKIAELNALRETNMKGVRL